MKSRYLFLCLGLVVLAACTKDVKDQVAADTQFAIPAAAREGDPIIVTGDVLNFISQEVFDATIVDLESQNSEINMPGFTSLYSFFSSVIAAETAQLNAFEAVYNTEELAVEHRAEYESAPEYLENASFFLQKTFATDGEPYIAMDIYSTTIAKLVNKYGFVIIGDVLYRFTENTIYSTSNYNTDITEFNLLTTPNSGLLDVATPVMTEGVAGSTCNCPNSQSHWVEKDYNGQLPKQRHQLHVQFVQQSVTIGGNCFSESKMYITGTHFRKKLFGGWIHDNVTNMHFEGSFNGPRSPVVYTNNVFSGYHFPNPFTMMNVSFNNVYQVTFTHFTDWNRQPYTSNLMDCFYVDHATYRMGTMQGPIPNSWTTISW